MKKMGRFAAILLVFTLVATLLVSIPALIKANEVVPSSNGSRAQDDPVEEDESDVDVPFEPEKTVRSISIQSKPDKLIYLRGQELDLTGLIVKVVYIDNTNTVVSSCPVSGYDPNTLGEQTITLSCEGKTASFTVAVYDIGDVNGDLVVNQADADLLLQYTAGWDVTIQTLPADVTGDGVVNGEDATLLLQYAAGWDVTLG